MRFQTPVPISKAEQLIGYDSNILSLGSCFAVNIAEKLQHFKFRSHCNPFGILFHPLAILEMLRRIVSGKPFTEADLFLHDGLWHCFDLHSQWSQPDQSAMLDSLNRMRDDMQQEMATSTHIIITYGTAWIYRNVKTDLVVANCHKVPQVNFKKELMSVEAIEICISETLQLLQAHCPDATVTFTVSPVRHIKDGFVENQRSKAHLIAAVHETLSVTTLGKREAYFPSYEIMMDELRDYRFYADDMLHPSQMAIDYIWERFVAAQVSDSAVVTMQEVGSVQKAMQHKPFHPDSASHALFTAKLQERIAKLQSHYPHMQF